MLEYESVIENDFYDTYKIKKGDSLFKISQKLCQQRHNKNTQYNDYEQHTLTPRK